MDEKNGPNCAKVSYLQITLTFQKSPAHNLPQKTLALKLATHAENPQNYETLQTKLQHEQDLLLVVLCEKNMPLGNCYINKKQPAY